jgi:hypothetical protein
MKCPVCKGSRTQWFVGEAETECGFCKGTGVACDDCAELQQKLDAAYAAMRDALNNCETCRHPWSSTVLCARCQTFARLLPSRW